LATTKQAEQGRTESLLADEYLSDLVYDALLERGEASKVSEITLEINNPKITVPLVRRVLSDSPRFVLVDRQWDLSARYLDRSRPTERNLTEVIEAAGKPLSLITLATELSAIYYKDSTSYFQLIQRATRNENSYFKTPGNEFGLMKWVPVVDAETVEDVLYDNKIAAETLEPFLAASAQANWTTARYADATFAIVQAAKRPLPHRFLGVLAWHALREKYDPVKHVLACLVDSRLVWLSGRSGGRWLTRAQADRLENMLEEQGRGLTFDEPEEVTPAPVVAPVAPAEAETPETAAPAPVAVADAVKPLDITTEDLTALAQIVSERGAATDVTDLLGLRFEVVPGDPSFRADLESLEERLKADDGFLYVGAGRFREPNSLPLFVYSVPEFLAFPELQFISMDGEIMDEEIAEEGYASTLRADVMNPLSQDVLDDEGRYTGSVAPDAPSLRLVVKAHHKEIGTFPLCQVPDGFFPNDAGVVEIAVRDPNGETHDVVVNNETRLAYNLFGLYEFLPADSGATFILHRTGRPYEFRFEPGDENDPQVFVEPNRMTELLGLREQAEESGDVATFDIVCEILAHHVKGLDYVQALTEVNIVRRVSRRKLASILSNYHCFMQKPGQPQWRFDAKKRDLGTDRAKRKYIKREM
jgi:hypothetical protein